MTHSTQITTIVTRCTRDGQIAWQAVANMLGVTRETAMRLYGPQPSVIVLEPENIGPVTELPEPECYRSPYAKTDGLRMLIMCQLTKRPSSSDDVAAAIGYGVKSVRVRLSQMQADGLLRHSEMVPYTWTVTEFGAEVWRRENERKGKNVTFTPKAEYRPRPEVAVKVSCAPVSTMTELGFFEEAPLPRDDQDKIEFSILTGRHQMPRGSAHANAVLTEADVVGIRRRARAGELMASLAKDYGVSRANIAKVCRRKSWKQVL